MITPFSSCTTYNFRNYNKYFHREHRNLEVYKLLLLRNYHAISILVQYTIIAIFLELRSHRPFEVCREGAPAPGAGLHDRQGRGQTPVLPIRRLQVPRHRVSVPQSESKR